MNVAIIASAGRSERFGEQNKLFVRINGKPILQHTLDAFLANPLIDEIIIVCNKDNEELFRAELDFHGVNVALVTGGENRTASVYEGLTYIEERFEGNCKNVIIHDGARPFVSQYEISKCVEIAEKFGSAVCVLPVHDTLRRVDNGKIVSDVDRENAFRMLTPQGFNFEKILLAYRRHENESFTDDASVFKEEYADVFTFNGYAENIKITTQSDLACIRRIGTGYDIHRLEAGRKLVLGGVDVNSPVGSVAHSDGDAALHAVIDAMLTGAGLSDIGTYFPDTSDEFKGISSLELLSRANQLIGDEGFCVGNLSIVIILQKTKLAPYIPEMKKRIAETLGIDVGCVGISAKTNEGIGALGNGSAVMCQCMTMLEKIR